MKKLPLTITSNAYNKILDIKQHKNIDDEYCLRLGVKSAGCGIASYVIGFDHQAEKDEIYQLEDITVVIEKIQVMHLAGKKVDFEEVDGEYGFVFKENN